MRTWLRPSLLYGIWELTPSSSRHQEHLSGSRFYRALGVKTVRMVIKTTELSSDFIRIIEGKEF